MRLVTTRPPPSDASSAPNHQSSVGLNGDSSIGANKTHFEVKHGELKEAQTVGTMHWSLVKRFGELRSALAHIFLNLGYMVGVERVFVGSVLLILNCLNLKIVTGNICVELAFSTPIFSSFLVASALEGTGRDHE
ncbi:hypothetical protein Dimus_017850, partial [Dionaea muscipula]